MGGNVRKQWLVLEHDELEAEQNKFSASHGPFNTKQEALKFIEDDAMDTINGEYGMDGLCGGANHDWGSTFTLVSIEGHYKPVPQVSVMVRVKTAKMKEE
jgi:hypothetical protein